MLSARRIRFVQEYCVDWNGTQAAIRAGYSEKGAGDRACDLLANAEIKKEIDLEKEKIATVARLSPAWVLEQWMKIAMADPNELTQIRRCNCRHCWGAGFRYQWTEVEFELALEKSVNHGSAPPDGLGGFGFEVNREPNPECTECGGDGIESIHVADTRKLKGNARHLYGGVQRTKDGLKVIQRDQGEALKNLSAYLGMSKEQLNLVHLQAKTLGDFYGDAKPGT